MTKTITIIVAFFAKVNADVNPEDVTCDIDLAHVTPLVNGESVGRVEEFTTTEVTEND